MSKKECQEPEVQYHDQAFAEELAAAKLHTEQKQPQAAKCNELCALWWCSVAGATGATSASASSANKHSSDSRGSLQFVDGLARQVQSPSPASAGPAAGTSEDRVCSETFCWISSRGLGPFGLRAAEALQPMLGRAQIELIRDLRRSWRRTRGCSGMQN